MWRQLLVCNKAQGLVAEGHLIWWVQVYLVPEWWRHESKKTSGWRDASIMYTISLVPAIQANLISWVRWWGDERWNVLTKLKESSCFLSKLHHDLDDRYLHRHIPCNGQKSNVKSSWGFWLAAIIPCWYEFYVFYFLCFLVEQICVHRHLHIWGIYQSFVSRILHRRLHLPQRPMELAGLHGHQHGVIINHTLDVLIRQHTVHKITGFVNDAFLLRCNFISFYLVKWNKEASEAALTVKAKYFILDGSYLYSIFIVKFQTMFSN